MLVFGYEEPETDAAASVNLSATSGTTTPTLIDKELVVSPLAGTLQPLDTLPDEAFASGAMGKGIVIEPSSGILTSPVNGTVTTVFPTGHAIGITSEGGAELLIHVGVNTVKLKGQHFTKKVKEGEKVVKGQLLLEFDLEAIRAAGFVTATPVIVTNSSQYLDVLKSTGTEVPSGEILFTLIR